ncbi:XRE family transcriptional regulator [Streptomyces sp. NPDC052701]|uniref:XRE family transcriptional regulator n=1 Tax=Streptomyces sp. NPDC052701 TaxID=3155533 RepID=UPI0034188665
MVVLKHPDRRVFLALSTGALIKIANQWASIEPQRLSGVLNGRRVDAALLAWLESRADGLRALTNTNAPECTELVHALLRTTIGLIDKATYDHTTEGRLHQVAASAAQCVGWLHFDQGEYAAAQRHWIGALHAAHTADNRDLDAGILTDFAYFATWLTPPPVMTVSLLERAHSRTTSPAARALLHLRRASALATLGGASPTSRALIAAEHDLERAQPGTTPSWAAWVSPADLSIDAGRCWLTLGKPQRAEQSLSDGLRMLTSSRQRTRSLVLAYRAESAMGRRNFEAAATDARSALDTALTTDASRCIKLVDDAVKRITSRRSHPAVQNLHAYVRIVIPGKPSRR